ncbi:pilus assembly FimT family protein [Demequina soli]|uniref:pilus assembly FimT family protein n=1 Tax=Demequina soli TaxID=1638987 RepID=UPI000781548B|nr:prepilin-type N-terminal cleavage/methylation domain-containing protein [Demequina soli]
MNRLRDDDDGFTLAELIAYMVVLGILMTMASMIFLQIIENERYVRATAQANNTAQILYKAAEYDLRNAKTARVLWDGQLLLLSTRQASTAADDNGVCVAYFFDTAKQEVRRSSSLASTNTMAARDAASLTALRSLTANWTIYGDDTAPIISGSTGLPVFSPANVVVTSPGSVTVSLRFETFKNRKPVEFAKTIALRPQPDLTKICF